MDPAQLILAFSDAVLAAAALWTLVQINRMPIPRYYRWAAAFALACMGFAAALGAIRYAGVASVAEAHISASGFANLVAMPIMMLVALVWRTHKNSAFSATISLIITVTVGISIAIIAGLQLHAAANLVSVGLLSMYILAEPKASDAAFALLAILIFVTLIRTGQWLSLEWRLTYFHFGMAAALYCYKEQLRKA